MSSQFRPPTFAETVFRPFFERRTYLALTYALLGLPLGIFYFVFLVTGLSLGLGLFVTLAGVPILVFTVLGCRGLAQLERTLTASLLGSSMPRVERERGGGVFWRRLARQLRSGVTWRELAYLLIRFPVGIASFSIAVTVVGVSGQAIIEPFLVACGVPGNQFGSWQIDTVPEALLLVPPGIALLLIAPAVINAIARFERVLASYFLAHVSRADLRKAIARALARGEADAFNLLRDLELYFGPGPYLTPIRLEANLLAMQDLGLVSTVRSDGLGRYSLTARGRAELAAL